MAVKKNPKLTAEAGKRITTSRPKPNPNASGVAPLDPPGTKYITVNGQTVKVPPGYKYVPGTPGVQSATIEPFLSGNDMLTKADEQFNLDEGLRNVDSNLENTRSGNEYQKTEITKDAKKGEEMTVDSMIARGLFQSSIKDGEIYDIQSSAAMRRDYLDTTFRTATIEADNQKRLLRSRWDGIQQALNRRAVENAGAANAEAPDYITPPTEGGVQKLQTSDRPAGAKTIVKPSEKHGGAKWVFHYFPPAGGKPAKYVPVRPATTP